MSKLFNITSFSFAVLASACGSSGGGETLDSSTSGVSYYQDVKPIFDAKCAMCHNADGIGGFSLESYEAVSTQAGPIKLAISSGIMPPWPPNPECNDYLADRSITDEQRQLLIDWVDQGHQAGDAANPAPPIVTEQVRLTRVDREISMETAYTPNANATNPDDYRCFVIPWTESTTSYVTGFRAIPGNGKIVHHAIAFMASPGEVEGYLQRDADEPGQGYTCFGLPGGGFPIPTWLGAWIPGTLGQDYPVGTGLKVEPGSALVLQIHYNVSAAAAGPDLTTLQFRLESSVDREARIVPFADPLWAFAGTMGIQAGDADASHSYEAVPLSSIDWPTYDIYTAGLHMHQLGTRAVLSHKGLGQDEQCLLQIDDWNFHWQGEYRLAQPVRFDFGDSLRIECHWDNSAENQPYVNGVQQAPRDVLWGEGTGDEMCVGGVYIAQPAN